ncbi:hypothetical protein B296_00016397 [Ensete ventricosum]|uniref:Uncharacterized protein n=1 Tax=Ensete ventricosum TaxID=4639 RepID=A0A427B681_ENSVE|nr:hypothetical protein B296_00016397 [Ensete ventricosum]
MAVAFDHKQALRGAHGGHAQGAARPLARMVPELRAVLTFAPSTNGTFVNATESYLFQSIWRTHHPAAAVSQRRRIILPTTGHLLWSDDVGRLLLAVCGCFMTWRRVRAAGLLPHGAARRVPPTSTTSRSRPFVVFGSARPPSVSAQKLRTSLTLEEAEHESRSTSTPTLF